MNLSVAQSHSTYLPVILWYGSVDTGLGSRMSPNVFYFKMQNFISKFIKDDSGLETVEYVIISGLIVAAVITAVTAIGTWVNGKFDDLKTNLGA